MQYFSGSATEPSMQGTHGSSANPTLNLDADQEKEGSLKADSTTDEPTEDNTRKADNRNK